MSLTVEALAAKGIKLVQHVEGEFAKFEQVLASGTKVILAHGSTIDEILAAVEEQLRAHPGALGTDVSRSDGASEPRDLQERHSADVGPNDLPTPAADAVALAQSAAEAVSNTGPGPNVVPAGPSNEAEAASEPEADQSVIADAPGEVVTGRAEAPGESVPAPEAAPEGAVQS